MASASGMWNSVVVTMAMQTMGLSVAVASPVYSVKTANSVSTIPLTTATPIGVDATASVSVSLVPPNVHPSNGLSLETAVKSLVSALMPEPVHAAQSPAVHATIGVMTVSSATSASAT